MAGIEVHLEELVQPRRRLGAEPHLRRRNRRDERGSVWRFVSNQLNLVRMALSFGSHACSRGGEKWVLSPIFATSADLYKPWCLPEQTHERRSHRQIRPEP